MSHANATPRRPQDDLAKCVKTGTEAIAKQNWDLAIKMFSAAIRLVPENPVYRQGLRASQWKKYHCERSNAGQAYSTLSGIRLWIKQARADKNWIELDHAAEAGLDLNPWDAQFNADLADAARERGFLEVATFALEQAVSLDRANNGFLISLADVYEMRNCRESAISTLKQVVQIDPQNGEVHSRIQRLRSEIQSSPTGSSTASTRDDVLVPNEFLASDLLRMIHEDPMDISPYKKLAELYRREGRIEAAVEMYKQACEISADPNNREQMDDVELEVLRYRLRCAENAAINPDDETSRQQMSKFANELTLREIEVFSRRSESDPNDLKLKLELARRLMRIKDFDRAIPLLIAASKDAQLANRAFLSLRWCFGAKGQ